MRLFPAQRGLRRKLNWRASVALGVAALVFACNDTPPDLRPWRPTDHDHTENPNSDQVQVTDAGAAEPGHGLDDVTIAAWKANCTSCHGPIGRGDGPQGPMVHAADLSRSEWQASVTDDQIAGTIRQGKGRMPGFALPDATVQRLVALVRMLDANRMQQAVDAANAPKSANAPASASATASGSAKAPAPAAASAHPKSN
jgi:cytochrome c oxidase cbb3-type subunit 3